MSQINFDMTLDKKMQLLNYIWSPFLFTEFSHIKAENIEFAPTRDCFHFTTKWLKLG